MLHAQVTAEQAIDNAHRQFSIKGCKDSTSSDEIVVCASDNAKYRLPLPVDPPPPDEHVPGEFSRTPLDALITRQCGVFQGQRRCNRRDLRAFGYGGGSVPIRLLVMLGKKLMNPDAELGPPGGYPIDPGKVR